MLNIQLGEEILPEEAIQPDERSMGLRASIRPEGAAAAAAAAADGACYAQRWEGAG